MIAPNPILIRITSIVFFLNVQWEYVTSVHYITGTMYTNVQLELSNEEMEDMACGSISLHEITPSAYLAIVLE